MVQSDNSVMHYLNVRHVPRIHPGLLALSALIATIPIYPVNARLYSILLDNAERGQDFMLSMVAVAAVLGLLVATRSSQNPEWKGFGKTFTLLAAVAYVCGIAGFIACLLNPGLPSILVALSGVLGGAGLIPVSLAWIARFSGDLRSVMVHGALVCAVAAVLNWMGSLLDGVPLVIMLVGLSAVGVFAPAVLPVRGASAAGAAGAVSAELHGELHDEASDQVIPGFARALKDLLSIIWLPLLGFLVYLFMTNAYEFPRDTIPVSTETISSLLAAALTLGVCLLHYSAPLVITVNKIVIPVCAGICVILGSFPAGTPAFLVGAASVYAPLIFMSIYAAASIVTVSKAGEFPMPFIVGLSVFAAAVISMMGGLLARNFNDVVNFGQLTWVVVVCYVAIITVELGYSSWKKECAPGDPAEAMGNIQDAAKSAGAQEQAELRDQLLTERLNVLAADKALTEREREILDYLARGFTSTYIASCLLISSNTVRTHMYNMYRKLGVTSRSELLALVNGSGAEGDEREE